jgi:nicotinamide riboside transporter PnuC
MTISFIGWALRWLATVLGILGNIFVVVKRPVVGMKIWVVANLLFVVGGIIIQDWATVVLFSVYTILAIIGFINWSSSSKRSRPGDSL